jgi:rhamnosyltransferase
MMSSLTASILIRTKNEAPFIGKALELISNQSFTPHEIIVVDSESTDNTVEIVRSWQGVRLIEMPAREFTFGRSLNLGFEIATGDIVISISAHAFPSSEHWLKNLMQHFENPQVAGVYGRQIPQADAWPPVQREYLSYYKDQPRIQTNPEEPSDRVFSNANSAIRYSCWQQHHFDEMLTAVEDQEWAWSMLKLGYHIVYEPDAVVYHSHNESLQKVMQRNYRETIALNTLYNREVSIWRALKVWFKSVQADIRYILQNQQDYRWLFRVPVYRAAAVYGCLKPSSWNGLWKLPTSLTNKHSETMS